jgi:serine protease Do
MVEYEQDYEEQSDEAVQLTEQSDEAVQHPPSHGEDTEYDPYYQKGDVSTKPVRTGGIGLGMLVLIIILSATLGALIALAMLPALYPDKIVLNEPPGVTSNVILNQYTPAQTDEQSDSPIVRIAGEVGPAVVGIANFQNGGYWFGGGLAEVSSGSGFIIDADNGYIVTNYHVVEDAEDLIVSLADGRDVHGVLIGGDSRTDLAVIQIKETEGLHAARLGDSGALKVGQYVVAIGNPGGTEFARTVTWGIVSATDRFLLLEGEASFNLIQTDAAINPGNSGGPLVNFDGLVVGINSAKNSSYGYEGMGFAIPISDALPVLNQLMEKGRVSHPGLEIRINDRYTEEYASYKDWPPGCYVASVIEGGGADQAGIEAGDIITHVEGEPVENSLKLAHQLFRYKPGDTVSISYYRDGDTDDILITLGEITGE